MSEDLFVFADFSGDYKDPLSRVVVLAALILSESQIYSVARHLNSLKDTVASWGIPVSDSKFEFKIQAILSGSGIWRNLRSEQKKMEIAVTLKATVPANPLFVTVVINKDNGGMGGAEKFSEFCTDQAKRVLLQLPERQKALLEEIVRKRHIRRGFGKLGWLSHLLFGLTTGLIHWERIPGQAQTIIDEQFTTEIEGSRLLFKMNSAGWPEIAKRNLFSMWPKNNQPDWHLGSTIKEADSRKHYGLQLVDYIAYTTMCVRRNPLSADFNRMALVNLPKLKQFDEYQGIEVFVSSRTSRRHFVHPRKLRTRLKYHRK